MKNRIVLLGPPASGKGTQAALLGAAFGIPNISTGEMLRQERARGTELGAEVDAYTSRGELFPDELALRVVRRWIAGRSRFLLDGFPRTLGQAQAFDGFLTEADLPLDTVYLFELPEGEIRARMLGRYTCGGCGAVFNERFHDVGEGTHCPRCGGALARRKDDTEESLDKRIQEYRARTLPVADHYKRRGTLKTVDVSPGREAVFKVLYDDILLAA